MVDCLHSMPEARCSILTPHKLGVMMFACNVSTCEVEAGGLEVQGQPQLTVEFQASLEYMRP